jgi:hypothetical protein
MLKQVIEEPKLLLEYPWIYKLFEQSKEFSLDWLRMAAMSIELSNGDPRHRSIDWDYLRDKLGPENPLYAQYYNDLDPSIEVIDRATRWGLFAIYGELAFYYGFNGKLINLTDIGLNVRLACRMMHDLVDKFNDVKQAEAYFGADPEAIDKRAELLKQELRVLTSLSEE